MWTRLYYDATLMFYAVSLTMFFSDVLQPRRRVNRAAVVLLFVAFLTMTGMMFARFSSIWTFPNYTRSDLMMFIAWLMLVITLALDSFLRLGLILFFANVVGFGLLLFAGDLQANSHQWFPRSDLLFVHIALAMLSEAAFAFAFVFALMYVLQDGNLRKHRWNEWFMRLPSLASLDALVLVMTAVGFFLLFVAMAIGNVWAKLVLNEWFLLSPKPLATIVTWLMYAIFLWQRVRRGGSTRTLMLYQCACFLATLLNLVAIGNLSPFHHVN